MKAMLVLASVLGLAPLAQAETQNLTRCREVAQYVESTGVRVQWKLRGVNVMNTDDQVVRTLEFRVKMQPAGDCHGTGDFGQATYDARRSATIVFADRLKLAAIFATTPSLLFSSQIVSLFGELTAYHAVVASLIAEAGFETFEPIAGNFLPVFPSVGRLPKELSDDRLLGVGTIGARYYQLILADESVELGL